MKRSILFFASVLLVAALAICSCNKPNPNPDPTPGPDPSDEPTPTPTPPDPIPAPEVAIIKISHSTISYDSSGGAVSVSVICDHDWTASVSETWLSLDHSQGTASDNAVYITVSCSPNQTYDSRSAVLTVKSLDNTVNVQVNQDGKSTSLSIISSTSVEMESFDGCCCQDGTTISFTTNRDWTISCDSNWVHLDKESGLASDSPISVLVKCDRNTTSENRTATVTVDASGTTATVTITALAFRAPAPFSAEVFFEDFENSEHVSAWTNIDRDGDGFSWEMKGTYDNMSVMSGSYMISSASYDNGNYVALVPDNWMFSPAIQLSSKEHYVSYWICPQDPEYAEEHVGVYVTEAISENQDLEKNSTMIHQSTASKGDPIMTREVSGGRTYELHIAKIPAAFCGKTVYIGFRHFNCSDHFKVNLDDVKVTEGYPQIPTASPTAVPKQAFQMPGFESRR